MACKGEATGLDMKDIEAIEAVRAANPEDGADPKGKMAKLLADGGLVKLARLVRLAPDSRHRTRRLHFTSLKRTRQSRSSIA
jgi:hypothetical protein